MEIILLEKIRRLGNVGDLVQVKNGYARNFLIPEGKAVFATPSNIADFESRRAELEKKAETAFAAAKELATKLNAISLVIRAIASEQGKLYGSVGINEIQEALREKSMEIDKRDILLPDGVFHSLGNYVINIQLHSDVTAEIKLDIVAS